jgi:dephospho-CoA kinase
MSADDARSRVLAQASDAERHAAADVWLDNSGTAQQLRAAVDGLWSSRLEPLALNLAAGRTAARSTQAVLVDSDPGWAAAGQRLAARVARAAGERALRVDHIGSTSAPDLLAKDCIDLQVVVADLGVAGEVADDLHGAGLVRRQGRWWDGDPNAGDDKALAQNADPGQMVNCHVRTASSPAWRDALLLRDWLRATPSAVEEYAALKRTLAAQPHETVDEYAERKTPWIREALERAVAWATPTTGGPAAG